MTAQLTIRNASETELDHLARLWHDTWHESHAPIVPAELTRRRTLDNFRQRLEHALPRIRVTGPAGAPVGFSVIQDGELYQLFVSAEARGTGAAAALIADAETRLRESGIETAWLACAIGNQRAARFYEKSGWSRVGTMVNRLVTPEGEYLLEVGRYEKPRTRPSSDSET